MSDPTERETCPRYDWGYDGMEQDADGLYVDAEEVVSRDEKIAELEHQLEVVRIYSRDMEWLSVELIAERDEAQAKLAEVIKDRDLTSGGPALHRGGPDHVIKVTPDWFDRCDALLARPTREADHG